MIKYLTLSILLISFSSYSVDIDDSRTKIMGLLNTWNLLGLGPEIPSQIPSDLSLNNGNGKVSPGELAIVTHNQLESFVMPCYVKLITWDSSKWIRQDTFAEIINLDKKECLTFDSEPGYFRECLLSIIHFKLPNKAIIAANKFIPPGTQFLCQGPYSSFQFEIND